MTTTATVRASLPVVPLGAPRSRDLCTDCGVSRSRHAGRCGRACQFIHPRYAELERAAHGRTWDPERSDERWFGPFETMVRARLRRPAAGAQWTGITTRLAEHLLESGTVEAVLATASEPGDPWRPRPVLVRHAADMRQCRGMKMGFSPVLGLLDEVERLGLRRIAVIGVPCQIHALRALEAELGLERLYVIGTPCSDNTSTERFRTFLTLLTTRPDDVTWMEFMPDYHVELRFRDGSERRIPFIDLPIRDLPEDFFPLTCRSCVDYTNRLADITVGYMGGDGEQWLLVRNARGREMLSGLEGELDCSAPTSRGNRTRAVRAFLAALETAAGGLPARRAPRPLRPLVRWSMERFGPRGLEFARTRVEMKLVEAITSLRRHRPRRVRRAIPPYAWALAARYGIAPTPDEGPTAPGAV